MNNYEYIVAQLPVLHRDCCQGKDGIDADSVISSIMELLSEKDRQTAGLLLTGYDGESLDYDFYIKVLGHKNRFIREFFKYDLNVRNAKVEYLNRCLGRMAGVDMIVIEDKSDEEFDERPEVDAVLSGSDILRRERGLDDLMWNKIEELTVLNVFDIDCILGFLAKLKIVDRWLKLDPRTGKELFRKLVTEIRSTYDNEKNKIEV